MGPNIENFDCRVEGDILVNILTLVDIGYKKVISNHQFTIMREMTSNKRGPGPTKMGPNIEKFDCRVEINILVNILMLVNIGQKKSDFKSLFHYNARNDVK